MKLLCVIPARGGSKRIPRKNIKVFRGKPIICYSIYSALSAGCFSKIIVSTDDLEIANVSRAHGALVPFLRPEKLSDDYSGTSDVVQHVVDKLEACGDVYDGVCCLYATAPFVRGSDLLDGLKLWRQAPSGVTVFTVTSYPFPIQRALTIDSEGRTNIIQPEFHSSRSQDLIETYHDAGQFYWASPAAWNCKNLIYQGGIPLVLPNWRVQDIDTAEDWIRAELMYKALETVHDSE